LIDAQAREEKMDHAARYLLRQEKAPPLLKAIREHILATRETLLPRSKAGQACNYTLALWKKLTLFLEYSSSMLVHFKRSRKGPIRVAIKLFGASASCLSRNMGLRARFVMNSRANL
jgi:hypothetical protein